MANYEPDRPAPCLAATLPYGFIKGRSSRGGNKRTIFFLANEYSRAIGIPGLVGDGKLGDSHVSVAEIVNAHIDVAAGKLDIEGLGHAYSCSSDRSALRKPIMRADADAPHAFAPAERSTSAQEYELMLDNGTLYVEQAPGEALGWRPGAPSEGIPLILNVWSPHYFTITRRGSDAELLARRTVESSRNPRVQKVLEYLKNFDAGI